jgi:hypothetical protein
MKMEYVSFTNSIYRHQHIVVYLESVQARLRSLRELQSATGEELSALLPSCVEEQL